MSFAFCESGDRRILRDQSGQNRPTDSSRPAPIVYSHSSALDRSAEINLRPTEDGFDAMGAFGLTAKANECRLLAVDARGKRREQLLSLADEYDAIHVALVRLQTEQKRISDDEAVPQIAQN